MATQPAASQNWVDNLNGWIDRQVIKNSGLAIVITTALTALSYFSAALLITATGASALAISVGSTLMLTTTIAAAWVFSKICIDNDPTLKAHQ